MSKVQKFGSRQGRYRPEQAAPPLQGVRLYGGKEVGREAGRDQAPCPGDVPGGTGVQVDRRVLKISYGTVFNWIKKWGEQVELPVSDKPVEIVELDDFHSYVGKKKLLLGMDCC